MIRALIIGLFLSFATAKGEDVLFASMNSKSNSLILINKEGRIVFDKSFDTFPFGLSFFKNGNFIVGNKDKWQVFNNKLEITKEYLKSNNTVYFTKDSFYLYVVINSKNIEFYTTYSENKNYLNNKDYYFASVETGGVYLFYKDNDTTCMDVIDSKDFKLKMNGIKLSKQYKFYGKYLFNFDNEYNITSIFDLESYTIVNKENIKYIAYIEESNLFIIEYKDTPKISLAQISIEQIIEKEIVDYLPLKLYGGFIFKKKDGWYNFSNNRLMRIDDDPYCRFKSDYYKVIVNDQKILIDYYSINKKIELNSFEYIWNEIILSDENIFLIKKDASAYSDLLDKNGNFILKDVKTYKLKSSNDKMDDKIYEIEFKKDTNWEMNINKKYFYRNKKHIIFIDVK